MGRDELTASNRASVRVACRGGAAQTVQAGIGGQRARRFSAIRARDAQPVACQVKARPGAWPIGFVTGGHCAQASDHA